MKNFTSVFQFVPFQNKLSFFIYQVNFPISDQHLNTLHSAIRTSSALPLTFSMSKNIISYIPLIWFLYIPVVASFQLADEEYAGLGMTEQVTSAVVLAVVVVAVVGWGPLVVLLVGGQQGQPASADTVLCTLGQLHFLLVAPVAQLGAGNYVEVEVVGVTVVVTVGVPVVVLLVAVAALLLLCLVAGDVAATAVLVMVTVVAEAGTVQVLLVGIAVGVFLHYFHYCWSILCQPKDYKI